MWIFEDFLFDKWNETCHFRTVKIWSFTFTMFSSWTLSASTSWTPSSWRPSTWKKPGFGTRPSLTFPSEASKSPELKCWISRWKNSLTFFAHLYLRCLAVPIDQRCIKSGDTQSTIMTFQVSVASKMASTDLTMGCPTLSPISACDNSHFLWVDRNVSQIGLVKSINTFYSICHSV